MSIYKAEHFDEAAVTMHGQKFKREGRLTPEPEYRPKTREVVEALNHVAPLSELAPAVLRALAELARVEEFEQGEIIYRIGEAINNFCLVAEGCVLISCFSPRGKTLLMLVGSHGVFGEMYVSPQHQGRCQVQAHIDTRLFRVPEPDFTRLCHLYPALAIAFAKIVVQRWQETQEALDDMIFLRARQRAIKLLAKLSGECADSGALGTNPLLHFSQDEFARMVGVTRERINVLMHELETEGIIKICHRALRINREALKRTLEEEGVTCPSAQAS